MKRIREVPAYPVSSFGGEVKNNFPNHLTRFLNRNIASFALKIATKVASLTCKKNLMHFARYRGSFDFEFFKDIFLLENNLIYFIFYYIRIWDRQKSQHFAILRPGLKRGSKIGTFAIDHNIWSRCLLSPKKYYVFQKQVGGYIGMFLGLSLWGIVEVAKDAAGFLSGKFASGGKISKKMY